MHKKIDYINMGLLFLSAFLAIQLPFKLFLFVYAVLGPLHYLTEIGWLHKRDYFTMGKKQWSWIWLVAGFTGLAVAFRYSFIWDKSALLMNQAIDYRAEWVQSILKVAGDTVYITFIMAIAFVLAKQLWQRVISFLLAIVCFFIIKDLPLYQSLFVILLPSVIHVSVFTWVFMLLGAMRNKGVTGYIALAICLLLVVSFFVLPFSWINTVVEKTDYKIINSAGFKYANIELLKLLSNSTSIFYSEIGIRIQCFIAFAYTYHYLNWFSKTSVIKWHNVNKSWLVITVVLWLASVGVYYYDYILGTVMLFMLSMAHVMLEFPLNIRSFIELKDRLFFNKFKTS